MTALQQAQRKIKDLETINKNMKNEFQNRFDEMMAKMDAMSAKHDAEMKKTNKIITDLNVKIDKLEKENDELKTKIKVLKEENASLKAENAILKADNDRMKKILNNDSNNSSNPPSTDIKPNKKVITNNRENSGKKVGGQVGHKGVSLSKKYVEEKIKNNEFNHEVIKVGKESDRYISKYIVDVEINVKAIEYRFFQDENGRHNIPKEFQTDVQYGSEIKTLCSILNTEGVVAINRLTDFVSSISHGKLNISNGTIINFVKELKLKSIPTIESIQQNLLSSELMYTDATTARCDNKNVSVRNYSTENYTWLNATDTKSMKDINKTGILPKYTGALMHDHETAVYNYGKKHGECNVHVSRYLKGDYENTKNSWSKDMRCFLNSLNVYRKKLIQGGIKEISNEKLEKYSAIYDDILKKGYKENEKLKSEYYKKEEKKLLNRLKKYKSNHLMFLYDFNIPFDNNLSEREIRHVKMKQKISGHFKSIEGLQGYLDIKSIIITCKNKALDFYEMIRKIYNNTPVTI